MLGVVPTATDKEITRAYRKLAKEHHPDANPGSEERFKEISAAYDVLGDAEKRKEYDEVRRHGPVGGFGQPGRRDVPHGGHGRPERPLRRAVRGRRRRADADPAWPAAGRRHGGAAAPVVPGRGARRHHLGQRAPGGALLELPRLWCRAGDVDAHLPALRRERGASTTTRACSRSARSAPIVSAGGRCSTRRARCATARAPSRRCARSRCASRPGSRAASASG